MADFIPVINPDEWRHVTGQPETHSVQTLELGELIEDGIFTWERIGWREFAYSDTQYRRLCNAFEDRFYFREISITPVGAWFKRLRYELAYRLMPKYKPMYAQLESGEFDPFQTGGEYSKERKVESEFPETLLSGTTQDYLSSGYDYERESIGRGNFADDFANYIEKVTSLDDTILNELDAKLFTNLYTTNVNGW